MEKKYLQAVGQYDMFTNRANNILAVHYEIGSKNKVTSKR